MTLAVAVDARGRYSNALENQVTITLSSNYTSGGEAFTANNAGLSRIDRVIVADVGGYVMTPLIQTAGTSCKLAIYNNSTTTAAAALAELAAGAYPNGVTNGVVKAIVIGV